MSLRDTLCGTGVALVTPFSAANNIDFEALGNLIEFVIKSGVEYVVTLGTTGETPTLDKSEKTDIINFTCERINGRIPVVVGIGGNNTKAVLKDLDYYPLDKAAAVLTASPYYNKPSQQGIFEHYKAVAKASAKPVILYNVPGRTGSNISADTTLRLSKEVENISGIKEASGNMVQCMHILRDRPADFLVTSGDDHVTLPLIAAGMDGVISVAANSFPKEFSEMVRLCLNEDYSSARRIHYNLLESFDLMFAENNPAGVKAFLSELGIIANHLRLPLVPLSIAVHEKVKNYLTKSELLRPLQPAAS